MNARCLSILISIFLAGCYATAKAQDSPTFTHAISLVIGNGVNPNTYSNGQQNALAQTTLSDAQTRTYTLEGPATVTGSVNLTASDSVTSSSVDLSGNHQMATTNSSNNGAAKEDCYDKVTFNVTTPLYYTFSYTLNLTGDSSSNPQGCVLLQGSSGGAPQFYMGKNVTYPFSYAPLTAPAAVSGILPVGSYTFMAYSLNTSGNVTNPYPTTNGSINSTYTLHAIPALRPTVTTSAATKITPTTATLNGTINPNGEPTTAYFEYWAGNLPHQTVSVTLNPVDSSVAQTVSAPLTGLVPGAAYQWFLAATNAAGTASPFGPTFLTPNLSSLQFDAASYSFHENVGLATVVVNRVGGSSGQVSVYCAVSGYPNKPVDCIIHKGEDGILRWNDGDIQPKFLDFDVTDSHIRDGSYEALTLTLTDVTGQAQLGNPSTATLAIFYDDPPLLNASPQVIPNPNTSGSYKVMNLLGVGAPNANYTIQSSPDLTPNSFTNLTTVTTDGSGNFQYLDPIVTPQKFYRVVYPNSFQTNGSNQVAPGKVQVNRGK